MARYHKWKGSQQQNVDENDHDHYECLHTQKYHLFVLGGHLRNREFAKEETSKRIIRTPG